MRVALAADHAGFPLRRTLADHLRGQGVEVLELGAESEAPYDYPVAADALVPMIREGRVDFGVAICGTGIGISIRMNRHRGIRAALCTSVEMAELARRHNHANVLALGARTTPPELARAILAAFLATAPDEGERHVRRVEGLDAPTSGEKAY